MMGLLVAGAFIAHAPALWPVFLYDDRNDILDNPSARSAIFFDRLAVTVRP